jgi:hypothetical protein
MGKQGNERDKEFTARVQTDRVGRLFLQRLGAVVEGLDKLEHGAGLYADEAMAFADRSGLHTI